MKKVLSVVLLINIVLLSGCVAKQQDDRIDNTLIQKENLKPNSIDVDEVKQLGIEDNNTQETVNDV
jgi:protein involved in sex pheromone biosynthesis